MSSPGGATRSARSSTTTDEARLEHIATECLAKAVHVVLAARLNRRASSGVTRDNRNRWFNLETEEVDVATPQVDLWKRDTSMTLVAEIYGEKKNARGDDKGGSPAQGGGGNAHLLEAWTFQVRRKDFGADNNSSSGSGSSGSSSSQTRLTRVQRLETPVVYKRAVIFLRSLFCFVRLLPAFSVYQVTKRSPSSKLLITSKIKVVEGKPAYDPEDFSLHEFKQIDTPVGDICAQVLYVSNPVEVLSREYGNSVMYVTPPKPATAATSSSSRAGANVVVTASGEKVDASSFSPAISGSQGFAPHSAPQVMRRQSWSYSRNQMQLEAANSRNKFSDVMVVDPVLEERRPTQNSSLPMRIPNATGRPPSSRGNSVDSSVGGGSSIRRSIVRTPGSSGCSSGSGSIKPLTAPCTSSSFGARVYTSLAASPEEYVVGFSMSHDKSSANSSANERIPMQLPTSALNRRKMEQSSSAGAATGQSIVKATTPGVQVVCSGPGGSSVKSVDSSEMGSYRVPLSCSPQLPFAITPKFSASASSMSYDFQTSPMDSGIPSIRLVRRGTSPRDSSELASMNCSPALENFLDGGMPFPPMLHGSYNKPRIANSNSGTYEEEDQDALPFALDSSPGDSSGRGRGEAQDAAIGAFVRALQEAPPLRNQDASSLSYRTLSSAMLELRQLRETLDTAKTALVK
ncbi:autophagy-related protein [Chloropicon primus]|uniref:Autophagy-related protein n=2 Tax=Chloropicon primus TaxID=1764295 RepID=A0A5B8MFD9_9CHLO|nr:autophagy-related protein [Chloropicon primus]|eukprot:QDZ19358.1 autophagy-related protein [Chloropicon primus]